MQSWMDKHTGSLEGKTVVITGATGGLGSAACRYILALGGKILMVNRDPEKSRNLCNELLEEFPMGRIDYLRADLTKIEEVKIVCDKLQKKPVDFLILNAGAYSIPREICSTGFDNVFMTNFVSHYYMVKRLLPLLEQRKGKIVAVGSIAHNYSHIDPQNMDFSQHEGASKVYGNSKRHLMFALTELMKNHPSVGFAIGHPGISFTNITAHYPKYLFMLIKWPMKLTFMRPKIAVRSIVEGMFLEVPYLHWIGPKLFDIWGNPSVKALKTCDEAERQEIFRHAEAMYETLTK